MYESESGVHTAMLRDHVGTEFSAYYNGGCAFEPYSEYTRLMMFHFPVLRIRDVSDPSSRIQHQNRGKIVVTLFCNTFIFE